MITTKTVLVVGAGASAPYGYPVGASLRKSILNLNSAEQFDFAKRAGLREANIYHQQLQEPLDIFVSAFRQSQAESIDAFLAHRDSFQDIGKRAISAVLLQKESQDALFFNEPEDHWYQYLLRYIAEEKWEQVDLSNLSVVTFNYDRSLEHYLLGVFMERFGKSREEVVNKLKQLKVVHVYGSLGSPLPENENSTDKFGDGVSATQVSHAASFIRVIPEGRDDDETLEEARKLLESADRIAFLGFGFDKTNLTRINAAKTCALHIERNGKAIQRRVMATCFQLKDAERRKAFYSTAGKVSNLELVDSHFFNANCTTMLRETLFFE